MAPSKAFLLLALFVFVFLHVASYAVQADEAKESTTPEDASKMARGHGWKRGSEDSKMANGRGWKRGSDDSKMANGRGWKRGSGDSKMARGHGWKRGGGGYNNGGD